MVRFLLVGIFIFILVLIGGGAQVSQSAQYEFAYSENLDLKFEFNIYDGVFFEKEVLQSIREAKSHVELFLFSFASPSVYKLLNEKMDDGLIVDLYVDRGFLIEFEDEEFVKHENFNLHVIDNLRMENQSIYMHHKFVLIDQRTLFWSSNNLSWYQDVFDPGFFIEIKNLLLIDFLNVELERLRRGQTGISKLRVGSYNPFLADLQFADEFLELWTSPGFKSFSFKNRLIELIDSADESLDVMSWMITDEDVFRAFVRAKRRGVAVKFIIDDYSLRQSESVFERVVSSGFEYRLDTSLQEGVVQDLFVDEYNAYFHFHSLIVDDKILVNGTNNWSFAGFLLNDELILVTDDDFAVGRFSEVFDFYWQKFL